MTVSHISQQLQGLKARNQQKAFITWKTKSQLGTNPKRKQTAPTAIIQLQTASQNRNIERKK